MDVEGREAGSFRVIQNTLVSLRVSGTLLGFQEKPVALLVQAVGEILEKSCRRQVPPRQMAARRGIPVEKPPPGIPQGFHDRLGDVRRCIAWFLGHRLELTAPLIVLFDTQCKTSVQLG